MLDLNSNQYGTVKYYEYELEVAKRNLELVTEAAVARIKDATKETACDVVVSMSEAIIIANDNVKATERTLERTKEKEKENENN